MIACLVSLATAAWSPFLEPLPIDDIWLAFLVPLSIGIAVVYKTIRMDNLDRLPSEAARLAAQILVFMVLAAALLWLITEQA